jgi:MFS transporter, PAT family, beta-lactamase induction signal transducer AmpG
VAWLAIFRSRRMAVLFFLGFSSGLPLLLTGQTLQAWLTAEGVPLDRIAAFSVVGLAYTFKFVWAPLLDRFRLPFLGRRRGWALALQLSLVVAIATMGTIDPVTQPGLLFAIAVVVAALAASQDIVIDAYKVDLLAPEERAAGAATYVIGYRVATLLTGTLALFLADFLPWRLIYIVIALLVLIGVAATLAAEEPPEPRRPATTLFEAIYLPFAELFGRLGLASALGVLVFVAIYKFGDYFAQALLIAFFRRGLGFEFSEIATIYKALGFAGMFLGGLFAGTLVAKFGLRRMLIAFGILQAATNLLYAWLGVVGPNYWIFGTAVLCDHLTGAMGTAAFLAFLMSVCSPAVSATQFALLTSLSSVGQRVFGPLADDIVVRLDPQGVGHLAMISGTIDQAVTPYAERAVASLDWGQLAPIGEHVARLYATLNPAGDSVVVAHQWPLFFSVTAAMAIPGIVLAVVVTRARPAG